MHLPPGAKLVLLGADALSHAVPLLSSLNSGSAWLVCLRWHQAAARSCDYSRIGARAATRCPRRSADREIYLVVEAACSAVSSSSPLSRLYTAWNALRARTRRWRTVASCRPSMRAISWEEKPATIDSRSGMRYAAES